MGKQQENVAGFKKASNDAQGTSSTFGYKWQDDNVFVDNLGTKIVFNFS